MEGSNLMASLADGYSITPNTVLYNKNLSSTAKVLYACISSHCAKTGKCFATNDYLAEKLGLTTRQVQKLLSELVNEKVIFIEFNDQKNKRLLYLDGVKKKSYPHAKNDIHNITNIKELDKSNSNVDVTEVKEVREIFDHYLKQFNSPRTLFTEGRKKAIARRLKVCGRDMLMEAITRTAASRFHRGENDRGWKADLDWILKTDEKVERLATMEVKNNGGGSRVLEI